MENCLYKIWFKQLDENGQVIGEGVYHKEYKTLGHAQRIARERYGDRTKFQYDISTRNPWVDYTVQEVCDICGKPHTVKSNAHGARFGDYMTLYSRSGAIPRDPKRHCKNFYKEYRICPDCIKKVKAFVDNLGGSDEN